MLRSELIEILKQASRDCQRDGEVMIEILKDRCDPVTGLQFCNDLMPIVDIGEALGHGDAITLIRIIGGD